MIDIGLGGVVFRGELHLDVGVGGTNRRRGGVGQIEAGVRQADVVDDVHELAGGNVLADGGIDVIAEGGSFFNAGAGVRADVNLEAARVNRGEEVLAEEEGQAAGGDDRKDDEENEEERGVIHGQRQEAEIADANSRSAIRRRAGIG